MVTAIAGVAALLATLVEVGRKALGATWVAHEVVQILVLPHAVVALVLLQVDRMLGKAGRQRVRGVVVAKVRGRR